jgi:hypothetical protein
MSMPETAMDENHSLVFGQFKIRLSWEASVVNPESETTFVKKFADKEFRTCIGGPNSTHYFASFFGGKGVHLILRAYDNF